jgi:intein/homing endonuclease
MQLNKITKENLMNDIRNDVSINNLVKKYGLAKSSIYHYYKKIKGRKSKILSFQPAYSENEGEIVGIFAGDGSQYFEPRGYHYEVNVHFGAHRRPYALYVQHLFESFFGKSFRLKDEGRVLRLRTLSKQVFNYFHEYMNYTPQIKHCTVHLKSLNVPEEFKIGFLRGLVDTDGSVLRDRKTRGRYIRYYTTSKILSEQIVRLLEELNLEIGVHLRITPGYKDYYIINVHKKSIDSFLKKIQPFKMMGQ